VRGQPGCIGYAFAETLDDPGHFVVLQRWRDQAAVDEHYSSQAFADYQAKIADLLVRTSELSLNVVQEALRPVGSTPPSTGNED
jgi:quinol monooxygenase YgiN